VAAAQTPGERMPENYVPCYDPGTMQSLGTMPAMNAREVRARVARAKEAQVTWAKSSFEQRRQLLRIFLRYILDHQEDICRCVLPGRGRGRRGEARWGAPAAAREPARLEGASGGAECLGLDPRQSAAAAARPLSAPYASPADTPPYRADIQLHPAAACTQPVDAALYHLTTSAWAMPRRTHRLQTQRPNAQTGLTAFAARRVAARESGKPMVDAAFGEVLVTCEKIKVTSRLPSPPLPYAAPCLPLQRRSGPTAMTLLTAP